MDSLDSDDKKNEKPRENWQEKIAKAKAARQAGQAIRRSKPPSLTTAIRTRL